MRAYDLAMQLWRMIEGGDVSDDSKWTLSDIKLAVQQTAANIISNEFYRDYKMFGESVLNSNYIKIYEDNPVFYNEKTGAYYSKVPVDILSLPKDYGVNSIYRTMNLNDPLTRTTAGTVAFFSHTIPNDMPSYYVLDKTIQFVRFDPAIKNVVMALIPALPEEINNDDVTEIKNIVLKQFMPAMAIPEDKINDQNSNIRQ